MDEIKRTRTVTWIERQIDESINVYQAIKSMSDLLASIALRMSEVLLSGHRVFVFGNGGSAADAQHWAAELSGRFYLDRPGLPVIALGTNISQITAVANDYGFDQVFARPLSGMAQAGDMVMAISTSGLSSNVIRALELSRELNMITVGFTGGTGGEMAPLCDYLVQIPAHDVARIQEGHELCGHIICAVVERTLFGEKDGILSQKTGREAS